MTVHLAESSQGPVQPDRGTAWVLSRHLLVAQSVASALDHQGEQARAIGWESVARHVPGMDRQADVAVVIDDLTTPGAMDDVADLVRLIPARVVVLTAHPATQVWGGLFEAGAHEVISSTGSLPTLADAVIRIAAGEVLTAGPDREVLRECWRRSVSEEEELIERLATLSPRERRVLDLLASGIPVSGIEQELGVSESTVRSQVKALRRKLGVDSQLGAVAVLRRIRTGVRGSAAVLVQRPPVD
jgi:DNA-binding NarL/FixJ family response regulator